MKMEEKEKIIFRKFRLSEYEIITMRFPSEHPRRRDVIQSEAKDLGNTH